MKKFIAILLAALMLLASAAFAETANTVTVSMPAVTLITKDVTKNMTLGDLKAPLAIATVNGVPTVQAKASTGASELISGTVQIAGNNLVVGSNAFDGTYAFDLNKVSADGKAASVLTLAVNSIATLGDSFLTSTISAMTEEGPNGIRVKSTTVPSENVTKTLKNILKLVGKFEAASALDLEELEDALDQFSGDAKVDMMYDPQSGKIELQLGLGDKQLTFSAIIGVTTSDVAFQSVDTASAKDVLSLSKEDRHELKQKLNPALSALLGYAATAGLSSFVPAK